MPDTVSALEARLASAKEVQERIDLVNALAWELRDLDQQRVYALAIRARELARAGAPGAGVYVKGLAESLRSLGWRSMRLSDYGVALSYLLEALSLVRDTEHVDVRATVLHGVSLAYLYMGYYGTALEHMLEALSLCRDVGDSGSEAGMLDDLGRLHLYMSEPQKALTYLRRSLQLAQEADLRKLQADALVNSCKAYRELGDYDQALACGLQSVELYRDAEAELGQARALNSLGDVHRALGDHEQALEYYSASARLSKQIGHYYEVVESLLRIGEVHHQRGETELALSNLQQALAVATEIRALREQFHCHRALADVYKGIPDFEAALRHHEQYHALREKVFGELADQRLRSLEVAHRVETVRKEAEVYQLRNVALQREIAAREQLIADLDAFAHMVAHDLKSPLGTIAGYAQLLLEQLPPTANADLIAFAEAINDVAFKMSGIIDGILTLSSVRQMNVVPKPLDMEEVVAEAERRLRETIAESGAEIVRPLRWPTVLGYAPWLEQVWVNYITNAIKYGGTPPRVELGAALQKDGVVRFWVRDNGPGISPEGQEKLFSAFGRLEGVPGAGYGLGLSIVKRIVEKLGGSVGVESEGVTGRGSTFTFTLPHSAE
jgi:signal transduction histidine kinase